MSVNPKKVSVIEIKGYPLLLKVWSRLLAKIPNPYRDLNLFIAEHNTKDYELRKGGWSHIGYIVVGREFVNLKDEYMYVIMLAHELGHQVLGHNHKYDPESSGNELDADHFGLYLAMMAGYDPIKYLKAQAKYEKWRKKGIKKSHVASHGTAEERQDLLTKQLQYLGYKI